MILSFLTSRMGAFLSAGAAALLLVTTGVQTVRLHFAERRADACENRERKAVAAAQTKTEAGKVISTKAASDLTAAKVEIQWRTRTLIKEVPTYVTPADDDRCIVPVGFVQLHDAAAAGLPGPAGGPVEAPSGVELSAVASTVATNYGAALEWRVEAQAWRAWYAEQAEVWNGK